MPTKDAVLAVARSFLGVTESPPGSNRTRIGVEFGWNGQPWCAMTVSLELIKAGFSIRKNAGADELGAELLGYHWQRVSPANLTSGDVIVFTFSHIGIVEARKDSGHVITIEGNHLDRCCRVVRANSSIRYGVRPPYSAPKPKEVPKVPDTSWAIPLQDCGNNGDRPDRIVAAAKAAGNAALLVQVPRAPQGGAQARLVRLSEIIHAYLYNSAARAGMDKLVK